MENEYSARNCIFCLILLGLMCATLSPTSRGFEAEKMRRLQELSSNLHLGITDSTICNWQELSSLLGLVAISLRIMSYSVEFLAGLSWQLCNHFHPPTLRYSLAGGRGNLIFYKISHVKDTMSEDKPHRENPDIFPYMKAYSYHNMKSAQDQREKRIVRKIKFTNIEAFYNSADTTTNSLHDFNYVKHRFTEQPSVSGICMISEAISLAWIYCAVSVAALCAAVCQVWQALDFVAELILNDQTDINPLHILKATLASITATCMRSKDSLVVVALTQSKINVSFVQFAKLLSNPSEPSHTAEQEPLEKVSIDLQQSEEHVLCQQDIEQPAFQPSAHIAAGNGSIVGESLEQNDAENQIGNSDLQQSVHEAAKGPHKSLLLREEKESSPSLKTRRSQGSRARALARSQRAEKLSILRSFYQKLDVLPGRTQLSVIEKRQMRAIIRKRVYNEALSSSEKSFLSILQKRLLSLKPPQHLQPAVTTTKFAESAQPAQPSFLELRPEVLVDAPEEVDDIWPEARKGQALATTPTDTQPDTQNAVDSIADGGVAAENATEIEQENVADDNVDTSQTAETINIIELETCERDALSDIWPESDEIVHSEATLALQSAEDNEIADRSDHFAPNIVRLDVAENQPERPGFASGRRITKDFSLVNPPGPSRGSPSPSAGRRITTDFSLVNPPGPSRGFSVVDVARRPERRAPMTTLPDTLPDTQNTLTTDEKFR